MWSWGRSWKRGAVAASNWPIDTASTARRGEKWDSSPSRVSASGYSARDRISSLAACSPPSTNPSSRPPFDSPFALLLHSLPRFRLLSLSLRATGKAGLGWTDDGAEQYGDAESTSVADAERRRRTALQANAKDVAVSLRPGTPTKRLHGVRRRFQGPNSRLS